MDGGTLCEEPSSLLFCHVLSSAFPSYWDSLTVDAYISVSALITKISVRYIRRLTVGNFHSHKDKPILRHD
jgi:hypothetical protein